MKHFDLSILIINHSNNFMFNIDIIQIPSWVQSDCVHRILDNCKKMIFQEYFPDICILNDVFSSFLHLKLLASYTKQHCARTLYSTVYSIQDEIEFSQTFSSHTCTEERGLS